MTEGTSREPPDKIGDDEAASLSRIAGRLNLCEDYASTKVVRKEIERRAIFVDIDQIGRETTVKAPTTAP
jgi:hypothetical protein